MLRCFSSYYTSSRALYTAHTHITATAASVAAAAAAVCGHCQSAALPAGAIMQSLQQQSRHLQPHHRGARTVRHMVHCSFSFANSERANRPTGRRNRYQEKKREQELRTIAQGLCNLSGKQLQAVSHLLTEAHLTEIRIGMDIPPTNQGRKRQVGLVMKLLRTDLDESTLGKLSEAVQQADRYNLPYSDSNIEQQVDVWMEGLVANKQETVDELFELLSSRQQDWQQLRTWVRQLQLHEQQQQEQQQQAAQEQPTQQQAPSLQDLQAADGVSDVAAADPEVLQLIQELNAPQQQQAQAAGGSSSKGKGGKNPVSVARRSIRRMLKPLAVVKL